MPPCQPACQPASQVKDSWECWKCSRNGTSGPQCWCWCWCWGQAGQVTPTVLARLPMTRPTRAAAGIGLVPGHPMSRGAHDATGLALLATGLARMPLDARKPAQDWHGVIGRDQLQVVGGEAPTLQFSPPVSRLSSHNLKPLESLWSLSRRLSRVFFPIDSLEISPSTHSSTSRAPQDAARQLFEGLFTKERCPLVSSHNSNPPLLQSSVDFSSLSLEFCQQ